VCIERPSQGKLYSVFSKENLSILEVSRVKIAMQDRKRLLLWFQPKTDARAEGRHSDRDSETAAQADISECDNQAFLAIYDRYSRTIYRFLVHMTGSLTIAEDLTQEAFVVILEIMSGEKQLGFDPEKGTLEGYLLGIARNLARRELRKGRRLVSLEGMLDLSIGNETNELLTGNGRISDESLAVVVARAELRSLYRAILELPTHYREVLVLCSLQEKSYKDAATLLQVTEGTIASRMNRAKGLLAAKMRQPSDEKSASSKAQ